MIHHMILIIFLLISETFEDTLKCPCQSEVSFCLPDTKYGFKCISKNTHLIRVKRKLNNICLNNGYQPKLGLPCICPKDYYGLKCEHQFTYSNNGSVFGACFLNPCRNSGICIETTNPAGYRCACKINFYGQRCDYFRADHSHRDYKILGFSILSLLPFFSLLIIFGLCICCCRQRKIPANPRFGGSRNTTFNRYSNHYNSSYPVIMQSNRPDVLLNQTKDISSPPSYDEVMNMSINMQKK